MRGIGSTLSRLPVARAFIAGAAILAGAFAPAAQAQDTRNSGEEAAMAIPRAPSLTGGAIGLPQPLAPSEAARIRRIFTLQARGQQDATDDPDHGRDEPGHERFEEHAGEQLTACGADRAQ